MGRYDRQELIEGWRQSVLAAAHVFVVGAGTTGNEVIKNLVLLGVGRITIADLDTVEEVNLSRSVLFREGDIGLPKATAAAARAREINGKLDIQGIKCDVIHGFGSGRYGNFDCVITTLDNLEARMWVNRYCRLNRVPLIDTGLKGPIGNVFVSAGDAGPCLECTWSAAQYGQLSEKYSCLKIGLPTDEAKIPMVITSAAVAAGIAAQECVRALHARDVADANVSAGSCRWFDLEGGAFLSWRHQRRAGCEACAMSDEAQPVLSNRLSIRDSPEVIKTALQGALAADAVELWFDKEIVYSGVCGACGAKVRLAHVPLGKFRRGLCEQCHQLAVTPDEHTAELRGALTLEELGVPAAHYLTAVYRSNGEIKGARLLVE